MKFKKRNLDIVIKSEGAALVTVIFISALLLTASVAMLTAVAANSRNTTDVLAETKAYYAAESGLQATINVLRNDDTVTYTYASANPSLSAKLPYNWPTTGTPTRVVIGQAPNTYSPNQGSAYSVVVNDPDNTQVSVAFNTNPLFYGSIGEIDSSDPKIIDVPSSTAANRTRITLTPNAGTTVNFGGGGALPELFRIQIVNTGSGASLASTSTKVTFRVDYRITAPLLPGASPLVVSLWGSVEPASSNSPPTVVKLGSEVYGLSGSTIDPCTTSTSVPPCTSPVLTLSSGAAATAVYGNITPIKPYRLRVVSTGYGPNGAFKKLEGIVRRDLFDGLGSGAATTMVGPNCTPGAAPLDHCFEPGTSAQVNYSGGDCSTGCVPSFGLTNAQYLAYVAAHPPHGDPTQMQPPPALLDTSNLPAWQQTPQNMDTMIIDPQRVAAQNAARYFTNGSNIQDPGNFAAGTGITFCEGSCRVSGSGGGILVVTGKLTNVGGFSFRGTIIVTGEEGWERNGGGGGQVIGNVIIAPYNRIPYVPESLSTTFLPPRYWITGGGNSDIIYSDVSAGFDNIPGISDLMGGVAEK